MSTACDDLGQLLDREAALTYLAEKQHVAGFEHLRKLRHLVNLKLHSAAIRGSSTAATASATASDPAVFACPVTGNVGSGTNTFLAVRPCGHVVSSKLLSTAPQSNCWVCNTPFDTVPATLPAAVQAAAQAACAAADPEGHAAAAVTTPGAWAGTDLLRVGPSPGELAAARVVLEWRRAGAAARRAGSKTKPKSAARSRRVDGTCRAMDAAAAGAIESAPDVATAELAVPSKRERLAIDAGAPAGDAAASDAAVAEEAAATVAHRRPASAASKRSRGGNAHVAAAAAAIAHTAAASVRSDAARAGSAWASMFHTSASRLPASADDVFIGASQRDKV